MPDTRWKKSQHCIDRSIDGETVLLDLKTGIYYSLNEVGSAVWRILQSGATAAEIAEIVSSDYDVEPNTVRADINELLNDLASEKLISEET